MKRQLIGIVVLCALVACVGCDPAWDAYQQIELGKPLSADSLLLTEGKTDGPVHIWGEQDRILVPVVVGILGVNAIVDVEGNVAGKGYVAQAYGHWGVCQSAAIRRVFEIEVPQYAYHNPPAEGLDESQDIIWPTHVTPEGTVELTEEDVLDIALWDAKAPTNVLEYLIFARRHLSDSGPIKDDQWDGIPLFSLLMYTGGQMHDFSELQRYGQQLTGMTEDGFDWTYRNPYGYTLRIQNLGDRRFRVEEKYFRVFDPFLIIPYIDMMNMSIWN
jgi:hypothetical protein